MMPTLMFHMLYPDEVTLQLVRVAFVSRPMRCAPSPDPRLEANDPHRLRVTFGLELGDAAHCELPMTEKQAQLVNAPLIEHHS